MIVIKWYGAFKIENDNIVEKFLFPTEERANILLKLRKGDYSVLNSFYEEDIKIEGEIKNKKELIQTAIELAKKEMNIALGKDYIMIETLNTYDDVNSIINLLKERLIEWDRIEIIKGEKNDTGNDLKKELELLTKLRDSLYKKIEGLAEDICPNITSLTGPIIAARLIASAGGIARLAKLPASTIQVLGAEDSFFKHLKSGSKCPKHGIIFSVPYIRNASRKNRGKIARTLAGKISIAAKVDYYNGKFIGDKLKEEMEIRIKEVKR